MAKKKKVKLDPEVFREAAVLIINDTEGYACPAIAAATAFLHHKVPLGYFFWYEDLGIDADIKNHQDFFASLFRPPCYFMNDSWWGDAGACAADAARVFALLLTAQILEEEQKSK